MKTLYVGDSVDKTKLISFFTEINSLTKDINMPVNLFVTIPTIFSMTITDFKEFNIESLLVREDNIFGISVDSLYDNNVNHLVIYPHTNIKVTKEVIPPNDIVSYSHLKIEIDLEFHMKAN